MMFKSGGIVAGSCTDSVPITICAGEWILPVWQFKKMRYDLNKDKKCYNAKNTMSLKAFRRMLK